MLRRLLTLHGVMTIPTVLVPGFSIVTDIAPGGSREFLGRMALLVWSAVFVPLAVALARHLQATWSREQTPLAAADQKTPAMRRRPVTRR